ncbi:MAG: hypothetical protein ACOVQ2_10205, partial [Flavobacterium sp.]
EDSDSFYIGIILTENNINKNNIDFKYLIKEKLKEFKNNIFIDTNENFFIWYAPNIENRKFIFEHLDIKIIYKIYSDDNYLNEITNNISNELNEILEFIKEEILKHLKN